MHDHIEPDRLLQLDDGTDLRAHRLSVFGLGDPTGDEGRARTTDVAGLRERTDGRRRKKREVERGILGGETAGVVAAREVDGTERRSTGADGTIPHPDGTVAFRECCGRGIQFGLHDGHTTGEAASEDGDLFDLLVGEGEPALQLVGEQRLILDGVRHVEQGGGCRHRHARRQLSERTEGRERAGEVSPPDVVTVDHPTHQGLRGGEPLRK